MDSRHSLGDGPYELQDAIASFVDHPEDLLSLALTCRRLYTVIVPDHLEFRHVRCDFNKLYVWEALLSRPRLAAGLRSLVLLNNSSSRAEIIPWTAVGYDSHDYQVYEPEPGHREASMVALTNLLYNTPFLRQLACNDSDDSDDWTDETLLKNFFIAMRNHCHSLQELDMRISTFSLIAWIKVMANPVFSNLTQFSIVKVSGYSHAILPFLPAFVEILAYGMPALRDLHIGGYGLQLFGLWEQARWQSLQRCTMYFIGASAEKGSFPVIARFLENHPKITCFGSTTLLLPGSIPFTTTFRSLLLTYPDQPFTKDTIAPPALRYIHSFELHSGLNSESISILSDMPSLRYLRYVYHHDVAEVVRLAPGLERLGVMLRDRELDSNEDKSSIEDLLAFKHLTHFVVYSYEPNSLSTTEIARVASIRSLRYIGVERDLWSLVERDENGEFLRCIELTDLAECDSPGYNWGGHYLGTPG
ncbi:hypothetical protein BU17DRAFT_62749 [Hysterangium stoloniferum]|nr:hypothetical protein BU17DRAFT_62749 [Hysterangium stoloniferum]